MSKYILTLAYILFLGYAMGLIYDYLHTNKILGVGIILYLTGSVVQQLEINQEYDEYED